MEVEDPDAEGIENFAPAGTPAVREQHVCDARNLVDFAVVNPHTYYISVVNSHRGLVEMDVLHLVKKNYCLLIVHGFGELLFVWRENQSNSLCFNRL